LSAAANFVAMVKDSRRGLIVGDETGGGYNSHNGFARVLYQLPNTGVKLEYSAVRVKYYLQHPQLDAYGVVPDFPVSNTLEDVINDQDPQLRFVLDHLIRQDPALGLN
jgi:C-terminal processing protease CtpA/Prc